MFGSADDPVYFDFAVLCLRISRSLIFVTCVQKVCAIFLQSIGKARAAAPLSVLRDVLLIVFSLLIPAAMGVTGIFWAAPLYGIKGVRSRGVLLTPSGFCYILNINSMNKYLIGGETG